ncbi:hypothetical protein CVD25_08385 [Bacillus canaveralius]|uniref:Methyltransferase FkbM domain-containing protein n=1 Tax=Bacillus canaveralius TaxID=1403243 RepID=A0A2N5GIE7_9BACI|nr:FkbM family methyltransferase [Bacillus canaveralius]PLR80746.1 hypothetical protein CU635_16985 [Bacillus canaveralius]PLR98376.1 hypothetical protein CVD25_08385 [Bacillus canaveralius]
MLPFVRSNVLLNGINTTFLTHLADMYNGAGLRAGVFWSEILHQLSGTIKPGSRVLDAGANIGTTAIYLAKIQPGAIIYCFEPDPLNFSLLNINIALNNVQNIHTFNYALGSEPRFIDFYRSDINFGDHRSATPISPDNVLGNFKRLPYRVPMVTPIDFFDQCYGDEKPSYFDLIKIDTQGADFDILKASLPMINHESIVIIEYSPYHLLQNGTSKTEIEGILSNFSEISYINPLKHPAHDSNINKDQILSDYDLYGKEWKWFYDIVLKKTQK